MRTVNLFGAALLALATSAWTHGAVAQTASPDTSATPPADSSTPPAPAKKPAHHTHHATSKEAPTKAGDKAVDDLNAESLDAAKANKPFTPPAATPVSDKKPAKATKPAKHKKAAKKDTAAATPDAAATPASSK